MLEVYRYNQASRFVKDAWEAKKKKNKAFSLRAWARQLGFINNSPLSLMLAGKRAIPKKYVPSFISSLDLSPDEGLYFETLVEMERAKSIQEKSFYQERLKVLSPLAVEFHEVESFKFLGNPIHMAILEMSDLQKFQAKASWIQGHLRIKASLHEIEEAFDRLIALGLLEKDKSGRFKKTNKHLTNRTDIADSGSQEYHQNISQIAAEQVRVQEVLEREFNGYSINIKRSDIPEAKRLMRKFVKEFAQRIEAVPGTGEETYQLNVQFFGLTKSIKGRGGK